MVRSRRRVSQQARILAILSVGSLGMVAMVVAAAACSSDPEATFVNASDGGAGGPIPEASFGGDAWGSTQCATCVKNTCIEESTRCRSEPTCARRLDCIDSCPTSATGALDQTCIDACAPPTGSAATSAYADFDQCRTHGAGLRCAGCGITVDEFTNPILTQSCPNPQHDAGPDATPAQEHCTACVGERCCGSQDRCKADKECTALRGCALDCSDDAGSGPDATFGSCRQNCIDAHDNALGMYSEVIECASIRCAAPCEVPFDPCINCINTTCADEWIECQADNDCNHLFRCYGTCKDDACRNACIPSHQKGQEKLSRILLCTQNNCPSCL